METISSTFTVTVAKATLTVTADDQSKTYGDPNPALTFSYSGFVNAENETVLDTPPTASTTADESTGAGTVIISVSGGSDDNYGFSFMNGTLTIDKATPTITFTSLSSVGIDAGNDAATIMLAATSDADMTNTNDIEFTLLSGPATLSIVDGNAVLTFGSTFGNVRVQATQAASANYNEGTAIQNIIVRRPRINVGSVEFFSFEQADYGSRMYTVSASDLIDNVTIMAPTELEISTDNTGFSSSITLLRQDGSNEIVDQPVSVYVRLVPQRTLGHQLWYLARLYRCGYPDK